MSERITIKHTIRLFVAIDAVSFIDALIEHDEVEMENFGGELKPKKEVKAKFLQPEDMRGKKFKLNMTGNWSAVIGQIVHEMGKFYTSKEK